MRAGFSGIVGRRAIALTLLNFISIVVPAGCGRESANSHQTTTPARALPPTMSIDMVRSDACACKNEACARQERARLIDLERSFEADATAAAICLDGPSSVPADQLLYRLGQFRDRMCSCPHRACGEATERALITWSLDNMERFKDVTPTAAQQRQADALTSEANACKERLPDVDTDTPAETSLPSTDVSIAEVRMQACACRDDECRDRSSGDRSKPASRGRVKAGQSIQDGLVYLANGQSCKSPCSFVRQLRGPHLRRCAWWRSRSSIAVTAAVSPSSLPQSSTGRFEVSSVETRS